MKRVIYRILCFLINIPIGAIGFLFIVLGFSFIFENDNPDHSVQLGIFCYFLALVILILPNILLYYKGKFDKKRMILYQVIPAIIGGVLYCIFQICIL